jgi:hypothetical protein
MSLEFLVQAVVKLLLYFGAIWAVVSWAYPGAQKWLRRKVRRRVERVRTARRTKRGVVLCLIAAPIMCFYVLDLRADWNRIHSNPLRRDALILVRQLREFADRAIETESEERISMLLFTEYTDRFEDRVHAVRYIFDGYGKRSEVLDKWATGQTHRLLNSPRAEAIKDIKKIAREIERLASEL